MLASEGDGLIFPWLKLQPVTLACWFSILAIGLLLFGSACGSTAAATPGDSPTEEPTPTFEPTATPVGDRSASPTPSPTLPPRTKMDEGRKSATERERSLSQVNDFLYQLQDIDLTAIGNTAYDLVIIDYSSDGSKAGEFSHEQLSALKNSTGGPKIVLAYMSIGEAEDYRSYWQSEWDERRPPWLAEENPDWPGNHKVRYWDFRWQSIIFEYADRIIDAGFDGRAIAS